MFDPAIATSTDLHWSPAATRERFACAIRTSTAGLWERLAAGELRIVDATTNTQHAALSLRVVPPLDRVPFKPSKRHLLELVLSGTPQKVVGYEFGLGPSSVSSLGALALRELGLNCPIGRVPVALATVVAASVLGREMPMEWRLVSGAPDHFEIRLAHPHHVLPLILSRAEREVACSMLDGLLHAEIARRRKRSSRTVANQIHAIFSKLGVSNRFQLLRVVVARGVSQPVSLELLAGGSNDVVTVDRLM